MSKLQKLSVKFETVFNHLNEAEVILQSIKEINPAEGESINRKFCELMCMIEEMQYEICMPLEMEEEEREEEIRVLERRLAELKSSR